MIRMIEILTGPEDEYNYCDEHGEYDKMEVMCPGCEQVDLQIDEAIERAHERVAKGGNYYG